MQLVTRLAAQGVVPPEVVLEAAREDAGVRSAILAAVDRGAPQFLVDLAAQFLATGDANEQADAFEALMRTESRDVARAALAWLDKLPDARARDACARMVRIVGEYAFACEIARSARRLREIALGVMHAPTWATVEQLIGDDTDLLLRIVREGRIDVPIEAIAKAALDGHAAPLIERLSAELALIDAPSTELRPMLFVLDRHYTDWITALDREPEQDELPADIDDNPEDFQRARRGARKQLAKLQKQLRRLMRS
jgi:hypothetical protein